MSPKREGPTKPPADEIDINEFDIDSEEITNAAEVGISAEEYEAAFGQIEAQLSLADTTLEKVQKDFDQEKLKATIVKKKIDTDTQKRFYDKIDAIKNRRTELIVEKEKITADRLARLENELSGADSNFDKNLKNLQNKLDDATKKAFAADSSYKNSQYNPLQITNRKKLEEIAASTKEIMYDLRKEKQLLLEAKIKQLEKSLSLVGKLLVIVKDLIQKDEASLQQLQYLKVGEIKLQTSRVAMANRIRSLTKMLSEI